LFEFRALGRLRWPQAIELPPLGVVEKTTRWGRQVAEKGLMIETGALA
jgi:hypothetical protein